MPMLKSKKKRLNRQNKRKAENEQFSKGIAFKYEMVEYFLSGEHVNDKMIEKFADDMAKYVTETKDVFHLNRYRLSRGVTEKTYESWLLRNKYLKEKHAYCKEIIGLRREERMGGYDPKTLAHTLYAYSKEWDKANRYKAQLKNMENEAKQQDIKIVFEDFKRKDNDES